MSSASNRFFVTALDDGSTLHGSLSSAKSLTQSWNDQTSTAVPSWTVAANQPVIRLTLMNGARRVQPMTGYTWQYNGVDIVFSNNISTDGKFQKGEETTTVNGQTIIIPWLKIIGNLAGSDNVDSDIITFNGNYNTTGAASPTSAEIVPFQASIQVRISRVTGSGFLGVLEFLNGVADITEKGQQITIMSQMYGGVDGGLIDISGYTARWYLNGTEVTNTSTAVPTHVIADLNVGGVHYHALKVGEADVTDNATVRCDFIKDNEVKCSAYVGIDDMQDPEYLYIQFNGANGNAASLRKGQSVTFYMWMGKTDDPTIDTSWTTFKIKLLDSNGNVILGTVSGFPNVDESDTEGWRTITNVTDNKHWITVSYDVVNTYGKNLTGIILASTSA